MLCWFCGMHVLVTVLAGTGAYILPLLQPAALLHDAILCLLQNSA